MTLVKVFPRTVLYTISSKQETRARKGVSQINITRDVFILILALSGIVTASTVKSVRDQSDATGEAATPMDYINAIQEMAEKQVEQTLSVVYDIFDAGSVIAFSKSPEEKEKALSQLETSNEMLDQLATGYQKDLEILQEKMETQMRSAKSGATATLEAGDSIKFDSLTLTVKDVTFEGAQEGVTKNEVFLELSVEGKKEYVRLRGGQEISYLGYRIKYVSFIYNEEFNSMQALIKVEKLA
jgi:H2-forming N5,N10-methylenetetrahydromethanopterin dehydrogenase-like enzyme